MKLEFSYDVCVCGGGWGCYAKKHKHFQKHEGGEAKNCIFLHKYTLGEVKKYIPKNTIKEGPQKNSNRFQIVLL